jgi:hypothetical protein
MNAKADRKDVTQVLVRMRAALKASLEDAAARHGVSTTAEIIRRLEDSFQLDAKLRELEIERQHLRESNNKLAERETEYLARERRLSDYVIQLQAQLLGERK